VVVFLLLRTCVFCVLCFDCSLSMLSVLEFDFECCDVPDVERASAGRH
jgi:hypothetical protein